MLHKKQGTNTPCNKILNTFYFMFMRYVILLANYVEINQDIDISYSFHCGNIRIKNLQTIF